MEANDLRQLISECPLRVEMNSGTVYLVEKPEFIMVGDYQAAFLIDFEGVKRTVVVSLLNIGSVVPFGEAAQP